MTAIRGIELAANLQALFTLQISDGVSEQSLPVVPEVALRVRYPAQTEYAPFGLQPRWLAGGFMVFGANAAAVFPEGLNPADNVDFRFEISAQGYVATQIDRQVSAAAITPSTESITTPNNHFDAMLIDAPVISLEVQLQPNPVALAGMVIDDNDFSSPIAGANVRVIAPSVEPAVVSDGLGRYRIDALPVAASVTLEIDDQGAVSTVEHIVDFSTPQNTRIISLNG